MNHLKNFQEYNQNEGLKELALGALLFITSCTNVSIHDKSGEKVSNPVQKEIKGKVASETTMTSKSGYYQIIKVNGEDGNTYDFKINQTIWTSNTWKIDDGDSVSIHFDENADASVYKLK